MRYSSRLDITEQYFGLFKVLFYYDTKDKRARWLCECACGNLKVISGHSLRRGEVTSCGCNKKKRPYVSPFKGTWGNICEQCGIEHSNTQGSSRFCSSACRAKFANKFSNTKEANKKRAEKTREYNLARGQLSEAHKRNVGLGSRKKFLLQDGEKIIVSLLQTSRRTTQKIFKRLGVGCSRCGWKEGTCDVHHIYGKKIENAESHDNLCLLCPNCHRLVHNKIIQNKELVSLALQIGDSWKEYYFGGKTENNIFNSNLLEEVNNSKLYIKKNKVIKVCPVCKKEFSSSSNLYCSQECFLETRRKFDVSKEELHNLVWNMPSKEVAALFGVSDNAISKRCKKLGIEKPPRGYWTKVNYTKI